MIHSASPQSWSAVIVAWFWSFGTDGRTDIMCENSDHYRRDRESASWINTNFHGFWVYWLLLFLCLFHRKDMWNNVSWKMGENENSIFKAFFTNLAYQKSVMDKMHFLENSITLTFELEEKLRKQDWKDFSVLCRFIRAVKFHIFRICHNFKSPLAVQILFLVEGWVKSNRS